MTYLCYLLAFIFALTLQRLSFTLAKLRNISCFANVLRNISQGNIVKKCYISNNDRIRIKGIA